MDARAALALYKIIDLEGGGEFAFHAMPDGGYSESKTANWEDTGIIGRSSPIKGYRDSSAKRVSISIPIFSSIEQGDGRTPKDVDDACRFFKSLVYPDYKGGIKPPHKCLLHMAEQFTLEVVVASVDITYLGPWDVNTGLTHRAVVNISFEEVDSIPKGWSEVRGAS